MTLSLDATPKGASSNSYATRAEAIAYFEGRLNTTAWPSDTALMDQALVAATNRLEAEDYYGVRTDPNQRLKWPRMYVPNDNEWLLWDSNVVPRYLKEAQYEVALWLLSQGSTDALANTGLEPFQQVSVGSLSVTPNLNYKAGDLPAVVKRLLRGFIASSGGGRLMRG
jgi:hypothetical protein